MLNIVQDLFLQLQCKNVQRVIFSFFFFIPAFLLADSPLTSTAFYRAYMDIDEVSRAEAGRLDPGILEFLFNDSENIGERLAVVNALGWNVKGKLLSEQMESFLKKKYGFKNTVILSMLSDDELVILAYRTALDDYFHPENSLPFLQEWERRFHSRSRAHAVILSLIKAQIAFENSWCDVWKIYHAAASDKKLKTDISGEALDIIQDYMILYKEECR